jgi:hypothetical protein
MCKTFFAFSLGKFDAFYLRILLHCVVCLLQPLYLCHYMGCTVLNFSVTRMLCNPVDHCEVCEQEKI